MTIIGEPQRTYLHTRHKKAYNIKYSIYDFISKQIKPQARILEMFGGIGINTYFVTKNADPKLLRAYEVDPICAEFLQKTYQNDSRVEIIEGDCFNECEDFDYTYIDGSNFSASNLSQYVGIFEILSKMTGEVFITDSGYFKFKFIKTEERPSQIREYYETYNRIFKNFYGLHIDTVYLGNEFAVMWLVRNPTLIQLEDYKIETTEWQKVTTKYDSFIWKKEN